ncbi:MAG: type II secretion system ATPase GspE [Deltaproteobacteria bacterium]|nr:type II secretion system ATPase GspE [Deltaproteobacteria bacterium]MCL5792792.1 type II secretion system ATPase GspE [Deltaproteobacteria bacterium]
MKQKKLIGDILLEDKVIESQQLEEVLAYQKEKGGRLGELLLTKFKYIKEADLLKALSKQFDIEYIQNLSGIKIDRELIQKFPKTLSRRFAILPILRVDGFVKLAVSDPTNIESINDAELLLDAPVIPVIVSQHDIINAVNMYYDRVQESTEQMVDELEDANLDNIALELNEPEDLIDSTDEAPIIRLINSLLYEAIKKRASDIHIEPYETEIVIRYRIDGILYEVIKPPKRFQSSILSRVKIMAGMNIAEKRLPQDGRIRIKMSGKDIDIRASIIPTSFGERAVLRLLDRSSVLIGLNSIGLSEEKLHLLKQLIKRTSGIILVTGPTGSGKTTTLYSVLSTLNSSELNILTIEDPVEYQIKGIGQIQVNPKIELTFANGLRSILRQDPDVVLVGEIRDKETAEIAVQASLTGHLVFSTLHTNDAAGGITRLVDIGVEPFLVSSSVVAIIAQRLVRTICPDCKTAYKPDNDELLEIGIKAAQLQDGIIYKGEGCNNCVNTGYRGRTGIYEIMLVDEELRSMITKGIDSSTIKREAIKKGMTTLKQDGARKVIEGTTSIQEVLRVTQEEVTEVV